MSCQQWPKPEWFHNGYEPGRKSKQNITDAKWGNHWTCNKRSQEIIFLVVLFLIHGFSKQINVFFNNILDKIPIVDHTQHFNFVFLSCEICVQNEFTLFNIYTFFKFMWKDVGRRTRSFTGWRFVSSCQLEYWYYQAKSLEFANIERLEPDAYFTTVSNVYDGASLLKSAFYSFSMKWLCWIFKSHF